MRRGSRTLPAEHAPQNAMTDADEIARFHDRCSELMRELLAGLAARPAARARSPRSRTRSVGRGGASRRCWAASRACGTIEFGGRRPYRFLDERVAPSGRWEMWMDDGQARAVLSARAREGVN